MKRLILVLFALVSIGPLRAQEAVMIKEPAELCYQDLKAHLPEAIRWDDAQLTVTSRPLLTSTWGDVEVIARVFPEHVQDKKKNKRVEACKIVVAVSAPRNSEAWNALSGSWLWRTAHLFQARVEDAMKEREKARDKETTK